MNTQDQLHKNIATELIALGNNMNSIHGHLKALGRAQDELIRRNETNLPRLVGDTTIDRLNDLAGKTADALVALNQRIEGISDHLNDTADDARSNTTCINEHSRRLQNLATLIGTAQLNPPLAARVDDLEVKTTATTAHTALIGAHHTAIAALRTEGLLRSERIKELETKAQRPCPNTAAIEPIREDIIALGKDGAQRTRRITALEHKNTH